MMQVRRATEADVPRIVEMGGRFVQAAWGFPADPDDTADYVRMVLGNGAVFLAGGAMLGAIAGGLPFNRTRVAVTELWWWNEGAKGDGLRVFSALEDWALNEVGADFITMTTVHEMNPAIAAFYERKGYRLRECCYVKAVGG